MNIVRFSKIFLLTSTSVGFSHVALAQSVASVDGDIVVTARKRAETSIAVPVVLTAVGSVELERRAVNTMDGLARLVPGLTIAEGGGTVQGGTIALRGVAGPDTNPFGDQAVSFNIDGVQVAKSSVRRLAFMDLQQVEVLKGPQALFFGKNSPGGIISLRSADPTSALEAKASLGYELKAHELRGEGYVAGPLTDTLGARLAFYGSDMRGWVRNIVPTGNAYAPKHQFGPRNKEYALRGTLKFDPTDRFSARLKVAYGHVRADGPNANSQTVSCPYGASQLPGIVDDCRPNSINNRGDIGQSFTQYEPGFRDGVPYQRQNQTLAGLELNYELAKGIDLTSVTGFYHTKFAASEHYTRYPGDSFLLFGFLPGAPLLPSYLTYSNREISQELRVTSSFEGPLNFTAGGIYSDTRSTTSAHTFLNPIDPFELNQYYLAQDGEAFSIFGQLRYNVIPEIELSAGGRYSHEKKNLPVTMADFTSSRNNPMVSYNSPIDHVSFNNFSPEFTVSYRPTSMLTLFGSYKRGFLSGGFNSSSAVPGVEINYGPQKIRGIEGGVKAALLGGALRANLSAYSYKVLGLQITAFEGGGVVGTIRNAGKVSVKGVEFDVNYITPIEGLSLSAAFNYNRGRYVEYFAPCYAGQTQALGCTLQIIGGMGTLQSLAGRQLSNAPEWSGNVGANYDRPVTANLKLGLSANVNFAGGYPTDATSAPQLRSPHRALVDAAIRFGDADDAWELALIGRNLTNKFYWSNGQQSLFTGGPSGGTGTSVLSDGVAAINRAREIMLRATVKFGQ